MKRIFLENLATKGMALFLAVFTWGYLFTQGNGIAPIEVAFNPPPLDREVFASVVYRDSKGRELKPGSPLAVTISGPRGQIETISKSQHLEYRPRFDPKDLSSSQGTHPIILQQADFDLPSTVQVQLPFQQIKLEYVKYLERELDLVLPSPPWEKGPREGSKVESVTILPPRIKAKVPADEADIKKVAIRPLPVADRFESLTLDRWELEPGSRILPQTQFRVEVKIVAVPATRRLQLDLHLLTKEENKARVKLDEKTVTAELQGPKELIESAPESAFAAYVLVTDADAATPGPKNINPPQLGCHILDPKYQGKVTVILKADAALENRQVKITVGQK